MAEPKVPQNKYYRETSRMRNLRKTLAKTKSHTVRIAILKEMLAEFQRRANRSRAASARMKAKLAEMAKKAGIAAKGSSKWTFRKVEQGTVGGARRIRNGARRTETRISTRTTPRLLWQKKRAVKRRAKQAKQANQGQQAQQQAKTGQAQQQARTQQAAKIRKLTPKSAKTAAPQLSPQQRGAQTRAANRTRLQASRSPAAGAVPAASVSAPGADRRSTVPPMPSDLIGRNRGGGSSAQSRTNAGGSPASAAPGGRKGPQAPGSGHSGAQPRLDLRRGSRSAVTQNNSLSGGSRTSKATPSSPSGVASKPSSRSKRSK